MGPRVSHPLQTLYTELHPSPFHYYSETHMMTVSRQYQSLCQWVPSRHDLIWMLWECQAAVLQLNEVSWAWWARPVTPASWFQIAGNRTNLVCKVKACLTPSPPEKQKQEISRLSEIKYGVQHCSDSMWPSGKGTHIWIIKVFMTPGSTWSRKKWTKTSKLQI